MTRLTGIHGIGNYHYLADAGSVASATEKISGDWARALSADFSQNSAAPKEQPTVEVAYYSHLLHRGTAQGDTDPAYLDDNAQDLLIGWVGQLIPGPVTAISQGARTARARGAAEWLTRHLGARVCRAALIFCREVSTYLSNPARRQAVRDAVAEVIARNQPEVIVAHSLGSVVAYETLWQYPALEIRLLLTLGSPLAMPGVIFERLDPQPVNGRGARPPGSAAWVNLADIGDIVATPRTGLALHFDGLDYDNPAIIIDERAFHGIREYLTSPDTARILSLYLSKGQ
jgi:hypothetical protein